MLVIYYIKINIKNISNKINMLTMTSTGKKISIHELFLKISKANSNLKIVNIMLNIVVGKSRIY